MTDATDGPDAGDGADGRNDDRALERLIEVIGKLPGLGPRSARRAVLAMVRRRERLLDPLVDALTEVRDTVQVCQTCGNLGTGPRCRICTDPTRDVTRLCVVRDVGDLWAIERSAAFQGRYQVLGGLLSALDGVTPETLRIPALAARVVEEGVREVILALPATVDGQTTAHVVQDYLEDTGATVTALGRGVPVGGELDYLDEGTLTAALSQRRPI
ncbi:MAG: recombination mediator RecR [Pseudomonadota bacterium]